MNNQDDRLINREEFVDLVKPLRGLKVTQSSKGIGTTLLMDIGRLRKVPRIPAKKLPSGLKIGGGNHLKGQASILITWDWRVERQCSVEFGSASSERKITNGIERLKGLTVESIEVFGRIPELVIQFRENRWLRSFVVIETQPEWGVFFRDGSCLYVKKGTIRKYPASP